MSWGISDKASEKERIFPFSVTATEAQTALVSTAKILIIYPFLQQ